MNLKWNNSSQLRVVECFLIVMGLFNKYVKTKAYHSENIKI